MHVGPEARLNSPTAFFPTSIPPSATYFPLSAFWNHVWLPIEALLSTWAAIWHCTGLPRRIPRLTCWNSIPHRFLGFPWTMRGFVACHMRYGFRSPCCLWLVSSGLGWMRCFSSNGANRFHRGGNLHLPVKCNGQVLTILSAFHCCSLYYRLSSNAGEQYCRGCAR